MIDKNIKDAYLTAIMEVVGIDIYEELTSRTVYSQDKIYFISQYETIVKLINEMGVENPVDLLTEDDLKLMVEYIPLIVQAYSSNIGKRFPKSSSIYKKPKNKDLTPES